MWFGRYRVLRGRALRGRGLVIWFGLLLFLAGLTIVMGRLTSGGDPTRSVPSQPSRFHPTNPP